MAPALLALEAAYSYVHANWGVIGPVVAIIEKELGSLVPGVKKAEIAIEALAPQLDGFKAMTPELQSAFNTGVKIFKLGASVKAALAPAAV